MTERPILFSGPMVRALLEGRKTQTRRIVKVPKHIVPDGLMPMTWERHDASLREQGVGDGARHYLTGARWEGERLFGNLRADLGYGVIACPYGAPGDRLWVRETWSHTGTGVWTIRDTFAAQDGGPVYRADEEIPGAKWWPSIHMPRAYSRLTLEVTGVRVERAQDISRVDAKAEGFLPSEGNGLESWNGQSYGNAQLAFAACWKDINGVKSWDANPWVWVLTFEVLQ